MSYEDKIRHWERHERHCDAVNCMTTSIKLEDIIFEGDLPETSTAKSMLFFHKFIYQTDCTVKLLTQMDNLEFTYNDNKLCITLKCDCLDSFSSACCDMNFNILCKVIMTAIDGTYPLSTPPLDAASRCLDGFNESFCMFCFTGRLLCKCLEKELTKEEFLAELHFFPACHACLKLRRGCVCNFNFHKLYRYYRKQALEGKILKKLNQIKRIAYIGSSNVPVCFNCNRIARFCICEPAYQLLYK